MTDYTRFQIGGFVSPLSNSTANSALKDADPALYEALSFWEGILNVHLGDRWDAECAALGIDYELIAGSVPYDPLPLFQEAQFKLPLLAVYRVSGQHGDRTVNKHHEVCRWGLDWILPPLTAGQLERLNPFLSAADKVLFDRTEQGFDPAYQAGLSVWEECLIERIDIKSSAYQWLQNRGPGSGLQSSSVNSAFPTLHLEIDVTERVMPLSSDFDVLAGIDGEITAETPDEASLTLIEF